LNGNAISATPVAPAAGEKWSVEKNPPKNMPLATTFARTTQPVRVSRTILSSNTGSRAVTLSRDSSIAYDGKQHQFVNSNTATTKTEEAVKADNAAPTGNAAAANRNAKIPNAPSAPGRSVAPANRPHVNPPTPPVASGRSAETRGAESHGGLWSGSAASNAPAVSSPSAGTSSSSHSSGGSGGAGGGHH
jgi:hypothetical protein